MTNETRSVPNLSPQPLAVLSAARTPFVRAFDAFLDGRTTRCGQHFPGDRSRGRPASNDNRTHGPSQLRIGTRGPGRRRTRLGIWSQRTGYRRWSRIDVEHPADLLTRDDSLVGESVPTSVLVAKTRRPEQLSSSIPQTDRRHRTWPDRPNLRTQHGSDRRSPGP